ncbi:MAG: hypothetical protein ACTHW2_10000, partial [Tissierella sp.]|uniref:hypothetical protein n=1 Tax=Tissierella sp. TaxID=41274 RepID=UPI003F9C99E4
MKEKSKLLTFLLSFIPGLAHFYIGYVDRGLIYMATIGVGFIASLGMGITMVGGAAVLLFVAGYSIVWLISLIDVFSVINKEPINSERSSFTEGEDVQMENTSFANKKMITLALSIVPGAGHMYLGKQKKGLSYMSMFFFTIFFMGWLRLNFLTFLLPVIWFYVFFDAFHLVNGEEVEEDFDIISFLPKISNSFIGKALIGIGLILIFNNVFYPIVMEFFQFGYRFINYIQTSIVAIIFIVIGIKMLKTKKEILRGE